MSQNVKILIIITRINTILGLNRIRFVVIQNQFKIYFLTCINICTCKSNTDVTRYCFCVLCIYFSIWYVSRKTIIPKLYKFYQNRSINEYVRKIFLKDRRKDGFFFVRCRRTYVLNNLEIWHSWLLYSKTKRLNTIKSIFSFLLNKVFVAARKHKKKRNKNGFILYPCDSPPGPEQ